MGRKLRAHVHVTNPETGERVVLGPDSDVPDWAADAISNEDAWEAEESKPEEEASKPAKRSAVTRRTSRGGDSGSD